MTPLGGILTLSFALLVLCQPRRMAAVSLIATVCYLTEGQVVNVAGFHFTAIRIVLLAGLVRVAVRGELRQFRSNRVDRSLIIYAFAILIISTLRVGTAEELVYQVGCLYNVLLSYFVFRCLLRDEADHRYVLAKVAFVIIPLALFMVFESFTGRNSFSVFGGVSQSSWVRDGQIRAQGAFRNPITAGAFGATFAMLFASLVFAGTRRRAALIGVVASLLIVICSHSSGPFLGLAVGILALGFWHWRRHMRIVRWGIIVAMVGLQLVMEAPMWFLIARVSDVVGGGGYYRAELIDQFLNHFSSWWLAGTSAAQDWMPFHLAVFGGADITNKFVSDGVNGGLVGLILSIALVVRCFQRLGVAMKINRGNEPAVEKFLWGIASTLTGSIGILFSVSYFDQMQVIWYFLLAWIAGVDIRKKQIAVSSAGERSRSVPEGMGLEGYRI
jgi:hypothetical protein